MMNGLKVFHDKIHELDYEGIEGLDAEITEQEYMDMLEILPPIRMSEDCSCFYMCEFLSGDLTTKFWSMDDKYFCMVVDFRKEFPKLTNKEYMMLR